MTSGYSGTPLAKMLTLKDGMRVWFNNMPDSIRAEIDQADVQLAGLAIGFVDTKKCAVNETWSGLKFVIRKELR